MDASRDQSREQPRAEDTREESREVTQADLSSIPSRTSRISRILQESRDRDRRSVLKTSRVSSLQGSIFVVSCFVAEVTFCFWWKHDP